ncbi:hypothetical protein FHS85_005194 [Rhodoligotrophos appendicifer]
MLRQPFIDRGSASAVLATIVAACAVLLMPEAQYWLD